MSPVNAAHRPPTDQCLNRVMSQPGSNQVATAILLPEVTSIPLDPRALRSSSFIGHLVDGLIGE